MVELGYCIGKCKNLQKCFFVKDYFICGHMMCYNIAIKFKHCILCGESKLKYIINNINDNEVILNNTILKRDILLLHLRM
jgi:hypothetical protein